MEFYSLPSLYVVVCIMRKYQNEVCLMKKVVIIVVAMKWMITDDDEDEEEELEYSEIQIGNQLLFECDECEGEGLGGKTGKM
ncbi:MAG: hypothetical protein EZS28_023550 [Streblomastix strix]|uniref:Uncharacterized protein n=1 Tax=Streblomastix strix TaxID=222440 RepID=A0A5J4VEY1_9EUKA|nr:MAG: hypothetical protein EZS28_023550 [Streblomastix strix]